MKSIYLLLSFLFLINISQAQTTYFVKSDATGANDGTSWADAYTTLHDALENYNANDEIWVAAGTYLPQQSSAWSGAPERNFYIYQDLKLYGGFDGSETMLFERDPATNVTILSGDLNDDDVENDFETNRSDNVTNVMFVDTLISSATVIDGFTISNGHAAGDTAIIHQTLGGGIIAWGSPQIGQCRFTQNYANVAGGLYLRGESSIEAAVTACVFDSNHAGDVGGGMVIVTFDSSKVVPVHDCQFIGNSAVNIGGGLAVGSTSIELNNCQFTENSNEVAGGGIFFAAFEGFGGHYQFEMTECDFNANVSGNGGAFWYETNALGNNNLTVTSCNFIGNQAVLTSEEDFPDGGAMLFLYFGTNDTSLDSIMVVDCLFENNTAERQGGGIAIYNGSGTDNHLEVNNCQFSENNSGSAGGGFFLGNYGGSGTEVNVMECDFVGNTSNHGGASYYISDSGNNNNLGFSDCEFSNNNAITSTTSNYPDGGALGFQYTTGNPTNDTITVTNCLLENNIAERLGGGIAFFNSHGTDNHMEISNCEIFGNIAGIDSEGGGMAMFEGANTSSLLVRNTHFSANTAEEVQGFFIGNFQNASLPGSRHIELLNCLFTDHNPNNGSIAMVTAAQDAELILTNCTFANNDCPAASLYPSSEYTKLTLQNTIMQSGSFPDFFLIPGNANSEVQSLGGNLIGSDALDAYLNNTDQSGANPMFEAGTYQLSQNSPAVDAGTIPDNPTATDFAGNDRIQGSCIDIGALESSYDAGTNCQTITSNHEVLADPSTVLIYPNPVSSIASISIENDWTGKLNLRIVNTLGQTVYTVDFEKFDWTTVLEFDASDLPKGMYRVLVSDGEVLSVSSFVKI